MGIGIALCRQTLDKLRVVETRFFVVSARSSAVLLPFIFANVAQGATVMSDKWKAYHNLSKHGFQHTTVNHKLQFIAEDGTTTQGIEGQWAHAKLQVRPSNASPFAYFYQPYTLHTLFAGITWSAGAKRRKDAAIASRRILVPPIFWWKSKCSINIPPPDAGNRQI